MPCDHRAFFCPLVAVPGFWLRLSPLQISPFSAYLLTCYYWLVGQNAPALAIAAIMLSHTAASLLFLGPLLIVGLLQLWCNRPSPVIRHPFFLILRPSPLTLAFLLGLSLSAFARLPAPRETLLNRRPFVLLLRLPYCLNEFILLLW